MADLTEADKKILLGENYQEVLAKAQAEGRAHSSSRQLWETHVEKCRNNKFSAAAILVVGAILFVSNFYAISGPSVMLITIFAVAIFLAGAAWYVHIWMTLRKLMANRPAS